MTVKGTFGIPLLTNERSSCSTTAMNRQQQIEQFAKLTATILGRCPHEFGLLPDADGFVKIKEFIQAVTETDGWRHIRISHVNDMMLMLPDPPVELDQTRIRAKDRGLLPEYRYCENPPKLLYVSIKQKSYPAVVANGIHPTVHSRIICCKDPAMAERIGKRRDPQPVLIPVHVGIMRDRGLTIHEAGEGIFLTDFIPADAFTGPPLAKLMPSSKRTEKKPDSVEIYKQQAQAGTFPFDPFPVNKPAGNMHKGKHGEKDTSWKRNKKRLRKEKNQYLPDL